MANQSFQHGSVRGVLHTFELSNASSALSSHNTATKLFLSAAIHVLDLKNIGEAPVRHVRSVRLLSENTSDAQLKQDAEELWPGAMALGANEIMEFSESVWYYE
ncbi:hypothetical protein BKA58DRAFT_208243 [Alternaria rosae]|uniref:uncharacterized protein n=1 Tax=Alternaria rosae TaxID=1187941 RepID=UPI001E8DFEFD|nr:uncharacterized protein BKA58DRAFT_208243 [Alternaria rosae]KAH6866628.1 hypothetical protein BKA58DRAFT_208243 [Alternaria rosae]